MKCQVPFVLKRVFFKIFATNARHQYVYVFKAFTDMSFDVLHVITNVFRWYINLLKLANALLESLFLSTPIQTVKEIR